MICISDGHIELASLLNCICLTVWHMALQQLKMNSVSGGSLRKRVRVHAKGSRAPAVGWWVGGVALQHSYWMVAGHYFSTAPTTMSVAGMCWLVHFFWGGESGADHQGKSTPRVPPSFTRLRGARCSHKKNAFANAIAIVQNTPLAALPLACVRSAEETVIPQMSLEIFRAHCW